MISSFYHLAAVVILVLLSWIGLGWATAKFLRADRLLRTGWPLLAAIGMSIVIALGGITNLFALTSATVMTAVTIVGLIFTIIASFTEFRRKNWHATSLWLIPPVLFATSVFLSSITSTRLNPGDDQLAYMLFPRQMLQTGTLLAPFNLRRLGTYGGQQFLQAQLLGLSETLSPDHGERDFALHGNILDTGLAPSSARASSGASCGRDPRANTSWHRS